MSFFSVILLNILYNFEEFDKEDNDSRLKIITFHN